MFKNENKLTWIYGWTNVLELRYLNGPRWTPQSAKQHTRWTLPLLLEIVSGTPIAEGNVSAPVPILVVSWWFRAVVIWLSWMSRLRMWVDTIEPCEWLETMMVSASWRSVIQLSLDVRLLCNLPKKNVHVDVTVAKLGVCIPFHPFVDDTISFQRNFGYLLQLNSIFILNCSVILTNLMLVPVGWTNEQKLEFTWDEMWIENKPLQRLSIT